VSVKDVLIFTLLDAAYQVHYKYYDYVLYKLTILLTYLLCCVDVALSCEDNGEIYSFSPLRLR